jgi:hypothetical protein
MGAIKSRKRPIPLPKTIYFYHGFTLASDGQVKFSYPESILWFSVNSANNLYYTGLLPLNSLAFIQEPTS